MPSPTGPSLPPPERLDVDVRGNMPAGLSGQMVGIGHDGIVYSVIIGERDAVSFRTQQLQTKSTFRNVLAFAGAILAFSDDSPAHELGAELDTFRLVDLAGQGRAVAPFPKLDPITRDLHLVARAHDGTQSQITVSAGALTRRERLIVDSPNRVADLALTVDRDVFVADGFVGIAPRAGEARTTWIATGVATPHPVHALDCGDAVVLLVLSPSLERWTLHPGAGTVEREMLDETVCRFAHVSDDTVNGAPRTMWTTSDQAIGQHDLTGSQPVYHRIRPHTRGDFAVVPDATRPPAGSSGWLVGFVHDTSGTPTELRVIDTADIAGPPIATVCIPRSIPRRMRCTWIPSTELSPSTKEHRP